MIKSRRQRAFIHELGHLVAKEITFREFGIREVGSIKLVFNHAYQDYEGEIAPLIHPWEDPAQPTVNHAEKLIDLEYGCMFQSYFEGKPFEHCFSEDGSGHLDLNMWSGTTPKSHKINLLLCSLQEQHFEDLSRSGAIREICRLRVEDFIETTDGDITKINIAKLRDIIRPLLKDVEPIFLDYLRQVKELVNGAY